MQCSESMLSGCLQGSSHNVISLTSYRTPFTPATPAKCRRRHPCKSMNAVARTDSIGADVEALTPHSGYHFDGRRSRFFEGWYFRIVLPGPGQSFAWMYSIENPSGQGTLPGVGAQVMGPDDSYLVQYSDDVKSFWADSSSLALGGCFKRAGQAAPPRVAVTERQFGGAVAEGFQATLTSTHGSLRRQQQEKAPGNLPSTVDSCRWSIDVEPAYGWGPQAGKQQSTAGWLAALPVFEPHWQIMMARGLASGWVEWDGQRTEFAQAPAYWEKNWGGGFPDKWFWVQCNSWDDAHCDAALTAVGAKRGILNLPGVKEDVGLIGVHFRGQFVELVPWNGSVSWEVAPWGRWNVAGRSDEYEAAVEATCSNSGTPLRAPTAEDGLAPRCRDSFFGSVRLRVWRLGSNGVRCEPPLLDAHSSSAAVEIGGGPWDEAWETEARMREPLKSLVKLPVDLEGATSLLPSRLRPPGI